MKRTGFLRVETDQELRARIFARFPLQQQLSWETLDTYADRLGMARRIIEDDAAPGVSR